MRELKLDMGILAFQQRKILGMEIVGYTISIEKTKHVVCGCARG